jgi:hypothetical protein
MTAKLKFTKDQVEAAYAGEASIADAARIQHAELACGRTAS